jgi:hypothetical protein
MNKSFSSLLNLGSILSLCVAAALSGCLGDGNDGGSEPLVAVAMPVAGFDIAETVSAQVKTLSDAGVHVSMTKCYRAVPVPFDPDNPAGRIGISPGPMVLYVHEIQLKNVNTAESLGFKKDYSTQDYDTTDMPCVTEPGTPGFLSPPG